MDPGFFKGQYWVLGVFLYLGFFGGFGGDMHSPSALVPKGFIPFLYHIFGASTPLPLLRSKFESSSGTAGSSLPLVGSLQYRTLPNSM